MEKNMEKEMETGVLWGFKELTVRFYIGEAVLITMYTHYGILV